MKVSIVIPNYNGEILLLKNLPSVINAGENTNNCISEILIVDDFSTDKSVGLIKKDFPEVKLIRHKANRGFTKTVNTGVRSSQGDLIVLLNIDVSVNKDFLESVLVHFNNPQVFGVSLHEKSYGPAKGAFQDGYIVHRALREKDVTSNTFWISGGSGVFRRSSWIKLGGFDESLFDFYWEDVDLSYRALKRGMRVLWEPNAKVFHKHESSTSERFDKRKMQKKQERNQLLFIWKNLTSRNLFKKHIKGLIKRVIRNPGYIVIVLLALIKIKAVSKARSKERKESKVSDETIFAGFKND